MKIFLVRLLTICTLACSALPAAETGTPSRMSVKVYGQMDEEGNVVANMIQGNVFTILGAETDAEGNKWYHIRTAFGIEGYMLEADVVRTAGSGVPEEPEQSEPDTYSIRTTGNANVREEPSLEAAVVGQIPAGTTLEPLETQENEEGQVWYLIRHEEIEGYISDLAVSKVEGEDTEPADSQEGTADDSFQTAQGDQQNNTEEPETAYGETGSQESGTEDSEVISREPEGEQTPTSAETAKPETDRDTQGGQEEQQESETEADRETAKGGIHLDKIVLLLAAGILISGLAMFFIIKRIEREQGKGSRKPQEKQIRKEKN